MLTLLGRMVRLTFQALILCQNEEKQKKCFHFFLVSPLPHSFLNQFFKSILSEQSDAYSWAQNAESVGNGVHFFLKTDSRVKFDAEYYGADRFFKKGAQSAHFGP